MRALVARFAALPMRGRIAIIVAFLAIVACGCAGSFAARDTRVALYPYTLLPDQVDEVDRKLAEWGVVHLALADNIRVDARRRDVLRARLAELGLPHRHLASTNEALAKAGALTPQTVLESQRLEGLEADVAIGLRSLDGVEDAHVTIAPAKTGDYADEHSTPTTAAITIALAPHARLSGATIRRYVAASVPGLDPEHVAVVDDRGVEMRGEADETPSSDELQAGLQSELDRVVGEGTSIVAVNVVRDASKREIHDIRRTPLGDRAIASTHSEERYASERKHYVKTNGTDDRGSDVRDERIESPPGGTQRLSVAVTVDASLAPQSAKIRDIAQASVGFDRDRGDTVSVVAIPFANRSMHAVAANRIPAWFGAMLGFIPSIATGIAIVVALAIVAKPSFAILGRALDRASLNDVRASAAGVAPVHVRGALAGEPAHTAAAVISALPTATAAAVLELYPPEERAAIVRRLSRPASPLLPSYEELLRADHRA